jgi:Domain of unknown function (DUF5710)/Clp amino terminal domain, pathogenicity island component
VADFDPGVAGPSSRGLRDGGEEAGENAALGLDGLTAGSKQALHLAQSLSHGEVEPEYLLLALMAQPDELLRGLLERLKVSPERIRGPLQALLPSRRVRYGGGEPRVSEALRRVLMVAFDEMRRLNDTYLSTEHLLVALAGQPSLAGQEDGCAGRVLRGAGVTRDRIYGVLKVVHDSRPAADPNPRDGVSSPPRGEIERPWIWLDVPYAEHGEAKRRGARWEARARSWYVPPGADPARFHQWLSVAGAKGRLAEERRAREVAEQRVATLEHELGSARCELAALARQLSAAEARAMALERERDRLVVQLERDTTILATLARGPEGAGPPR